MSVLAELVVLALVALAIWFVLSRAAGRPAQRWRAVTHTRQDGTYVVGVQGPGGERVVRELPPGLEGYELQSELRLAREEAEAQAAELNRAAT